MYAIVEIAGQQFKIEKDQTLFVHRLKDDEGSTVTFDNVLLIGDGDNVTLGAPAIEGAFAKANVLEHLKGDKVIVFKKKRRKGYRVRNGHRQYLSKIQITELGASGGKKASKPATKKAAPAPVKEEAPAVEKAAAPVVEKAPAKKAAPKTAGKKDDLKKIEGIGPKIASVLAENGIDTFAALAAADPAAISEMIKDVRGNHVTATWPAQAQLAADGHWDQLKDLQDRLDGGKEV